MAKDDDIIDTGRLGDIRKRLGKSLPDDWVMTTLGDAFKWGSGGTPKRTDTRFYGGNIPWLIIGDLNDGVVTESETTITEEGLKESSAKWVEPGSVLLAMYGSIGKLGIAGRRLTTNQAIAFTKPDPVDAKYLYYYLMYTRGDLASLGKGATQKNISQTVIKAFPFVLAPQDQQKRIVAEIEKQFSRLDEAVANLKRVKANLKRYKAAVLKAAVEGRLVETEAEVARREGRSYETGAQLLQRILETRRSQWKGKGKYKEPAAPDTTDLPQLPEGWVWVSLDQLSWDSSYGTSAKCAYENEGLPVLRIPNVDKAAIDITDIKYAPTDLKVAKAESLSPGDMLVIRTNGSKAIIGRAAVVTTQFQRPTTYASYLIRFRLLGDAVFSAWVLSYWQSYSSRSWIESRAATSAGQYNISMTVLATAPIPLPAANEQDRIVAEIDRRLSLLHETEAQVAANLQRAERLSQSVLSNAFSSDSNSLSYIGANRYGK